MREEGRRGAASLGPSSSMTRWYAFATMVRTRIATAVLLTRDTPRGLEVFIARRADALRFFGGYWAFTGGVIDAVDLADGEASRDDEVSHRRCAVRELFEETGVLPSELRRALPVHEAESLRQGLIGDDAGRRGADADTLQRWRTLLDAHPGALDAVAPFARITTPPFAPTLYRTCFVHAALPPGEAPTIIPGELVDGVFARAADLLAEWTRGERLIVPPALFFLSMLEQGNTLDDGLALAGSRCVELEAGRLHEVRNSPGVLMAPLDTPTLPPATTTNCYVVGHRRQVIIDPATPHESERQRLFDELDRRVAAGVVLDSVLVTHHHHDHVGSVAATSERYGIPVRAHVETLDRLPPGGHRGEPLADGDRIELGDAPDGTPGWHLVAHHTPGHDRGHLVFTENRYNAAIVGDLVSTVSTILIEPPEGHLATYLASLRRMLDVPIEMLYPAHGPAHRDGHALLRHYLEHRAKREQRLVDALDTDELRDIEMLTPIVYDDTPVELHPLAEKSLRAGLDKLVEDGRAERRGDAWLAVV